KGIAHQATDAERAELDGMLAREPKLRGGLTPLETDAQVAKDALPVVTACNASTGEFPDYARGRLQTVVRQTLGRPESSTGEPSSSPNWGWRWVLLGLATVTAVVALVALPIVRTLNTPVIQLAMLDTIGGTRGAATNEVQSLGQKWNGS